MFLCNSYIISTNLPPSITINNTQHFCRYSAHFLYYLSPPQTCAAHLITKQLRNTFSRAEFWHYEASINIFICACTHIHHTFAQFLFRTLDLNHPQLIMLPIPRSASQLPGLRSHGSNRRYGYDIRTHCSIGIRQRLARNYKKCINLLTSDYSMIASLPANLMERSWQTQWWPSLSTQHQHWLPILPGNASNGNIPCTFYLILIITLL